VKIRLGKIQGFGAVGHWLHQRMTAIAIIPLSVWFLTSLLGQMNSTYEEVVIWIRSPVVTVLMVFLIGGVFYHAKLGVQVVIEDYIHTEATKIILLGALTLSTTIGGIIGVLSILKIAFLTQF
tara:strand:- start:179 stop:547 length:369 start_codon:yes stop_codon:yes gene_type:complete